MVQKTVQFCLSDGNREALIIRWRTILILGLHEYFTNERRYLKIIVREIIDMFEGVIKALAESIGIQVIDKKFISIFQGVLKDTKISEEKKQHLIEINNSLSAHELNSIRNLIRNPEAHSLNLPDIPVESVARCWRLFNKAVRICDEQIINYAQGRPEFKDFFNIYTFFYKFVINKESIDLRKIKLFERTVSGKDQKGKDREINIDEERSVSELIQYILDGNWVQ